MEDGEGRDEDVKDLLSFSRHSASLLSRSLLSKLSCEELDVEVDSRDIDVDLGVFRDELLDEVSDSSSDS